MNNLSESESELFNLLKGGKEISLDKIQEAFPDVQRHSLIIRLKYLSAKVAPEGWIIEKVSGIGRGAKAVYKMTKKF